jgi:hypothetical protein
MPREPISAPFGVNVPGLPLAGFQLTLIGRIWVIPEDFFETPNGKKLIMIADCVFDASLVPGTCLRRFLDLKGSKKTPAEWQRASQ